MAITERQSRSMSWMITYGDMVTLLLTFFILLFVMMKEAENSVYRMINMILSETENELYSYIQASELIETINIERGTKGIQLTISSGALFELGDADIKPELVPMLEEIGRAVNRVHYITDKDDPKMMQFVSSLEKRGKRLDVEIRVEGHTDNWPINTPEFPSNWELSTMRALRVMKFITRESELPESNFSALGYGEYKPLHRNDTEKHRAANRRVEIYIDADIVGEVDEKRGEGGG